ncbi:hypothetical protein J4410_00605 [Candidatus Woesearchaeota archaeon]|nr:hypothetical protein [Candidatus Woesearchaeota archaeon]
MAFWTRDKAKELKNDLDQIRERLPDLTAHISDPSVTQRIIANIRGKIEEAKKDILAVAEEHKRKPWIDFRFDAKIDRMTQNEIAELNQLEIKLKEYEELALTLNTQKDISDFIELVEREAIIIKGREIFNEEQIKRFEDETLSVRLKANPDVRLGIRTTSDHVPIKNPKLVVRQLGARIIATHGGSHPAQFSFPKGRPIPLSDSVSCRTLAQDIRREMQGSELWPEYKIPSQHHLKIALTEGDIRRAA